MWHSPLARLGQIHLHVTGSDGPIRAQSLLPPGITNWVSFAAVCPEESQWYFWATSQKTTNKGIKPRSYCKAYLIIFLSLSLNITAFPGKRFKTPFTSFLKLISLQNILCVDKACNPQLCPRMSEHFCPLSTDNSWGCSVFSDSFSSATHRIQWAEMLYSCN